MWKLIMRGARGTPFVDVGSYASIAEAADVILRNESTSIGPLFLRVSVMAMFEPESDADILSNLSYQGAKHYYELTRSAN